MSERQNRKNILINIFISVTISCLCIGIINIYKFVTYDKPIGRAMPIPCSLLQAFQSQAQIYVAMHRAPPTTFNDFVNAEKPKENSNKIPLYIYDTTSKGINTSKLTLTFKPMLNDGVEEVTYYLKGTDITTSSKVQKTPLIEELLYEHEIIQLIGCIVALSIIIFFFLHCFFEYQYSHNKE